jgi:hypothetical protein
MTAAPRPLGGAPCLALFLKRETREKMAPAPAGMAASFAARPPVRRRTAETVQPQQASGLAASAKADTMRTCVTTSALPAAAAALVTASMGPKPAPRLERFRKRADWPPRRATGAPYHRHRSCRGSPSRTVGDPFGRGRISPPRRTAHQTHSGTAGADRLPQGSHDNRRRDRDQRGA